jgi:hypothetical protein
MEVMAGVDMVGAWVMGVQEGVATAVQDMETLQ